MAIYIIVFLFLLNGIRYEKLPWNSGLKQKWWFVELIILILLSGLRFRVGGDSLAYYDYYLENPSFKEILSNGLFSFNYGQAWYSLQNICQLFTDDFVLFQIVHAAIVNFSVFYFVKRYCKRPFLLIVFYFYMIYPNYNMEIMRQSLSIALYLWSIPLLIKKKYIKYYILTFFAFGFHNTAIILFILPIIYNVLSKRFSITAFLIIFFGVFVVGFTPIMSQINEYLDIVSLTDRLQSYGENLSNINGMIKYTAAFLVPMFFAVIYKADTKEENYFINIYLLMMAIVIPLIYFIRIVNYFEIPFYVVVFNALDKVLRKQNSNMNVISNSVIIGFVSIKSPRKPFIRILVLSLSLLFVWQVGERTTRYLNDRTAASGVPSHFYNMYIPYHSVFNPKTDDIREASYYNYWKY